jgi:carboxypeptidase C (cathepsin A)
MRRRTTFVLVLCALLSGGGLQCAAAEPPEGATAAVPVPAEQSAVTHHTVRVGGNDIRYTATAGTLLLKNSKGDDTASVFYAAYIADGPHARRPLTFLYNGGPGSSSAWLHMLSVGPRRVALNDAAPTLSAPSEIVNNDETLLDRSDLVFIDAVGTGFSRIVGKGKPEDFYGIDQDARAFAQFVRRYLTRNDRWNSPKFLFGESYGTTRSSVLVDELQGEGVDFRGVVLLSSFLNFLVDSTAPGDDLGYELYLPTQAAAAYYHERLPQQPPDLAAFLEGVRRFALGDYARALAAGTKLSAAERDSVVATLHADTGLSPDYLRRSDLRVSPDRFEKELLRDERRTTGRLDARYLGIDLDPVAESPDYDPTELAITGPVTAAFNRYVRDELHYKSEEEYRTTNYGEINAKWDFRREPTEGEPQNFPSSGVTGDLKDAMTKNPLLHVFSANGYYDFATPFFATEYMLDHLLLDPALRANLTFGYYRSGHMVYLEPAARKAFKADLARFYDRAAN